ncbi:MAG: carbamate kinase [Planctomycetota bacterium JB042]
MARRVVMCALGGNALLRAGETPSIEAQFRNARRALKPLVPMLREGVALCLTHGNGPQVGQILIRNQESLGKAYGIPLEVAVGQTEGEIGYLLQQTFVNLLAKERLPRDVVGLLTQVEVDPHDPDFKQPTKPVGPFLSKPKADALAERGFDVAHERGRGWRRVVPSPKPLRILEARVVAELVTKGCVVIAAGGGGIPVARRRGGFEGVAAVIDKDRAAGVLARQLRAHRMLLLTGVDHVMLGFGTKRARPVRELDVREARRLLDAGEFPPGSMGPKIEAAIEFLTNGGEEVLITSPERLTRGLARKSGTWIVP